ncbi:MAG TPA: AMP-binding protein, partial [Nocardioides sp.]|nr:AMP-binding protein [Nocardioides sp.]
MLGLETLPGLVRAAAEQYGAREAYVEHGVALTFAELRVRVEAAANAYAAAGVEPGDRVVLWGPNSIDWAVAALAVSCAGGVLVPVNSRYVGPEVADVVARTNAALVVVDDGFLGRDQLRELSDAGVTERVVTLLDAVSRAVPPRDLPEVSPDDVADILFTSGTTGRSKGAMSAHRQTIGVARAWAELGGVRQDDRYLVVNPFFHSFGYKIGIVVGLLTGCTLYPVATFDADETMRLIESERITVFPGAPTLYQSLLNAPGRAERDLSSLRL